MSPALALALQAQLAAMNPNLKAWADMLGIAEGTTTNPKTVDEGYDVLVNGIDAHGRVEYEVFTDYSMHPFTHRKPKTINSHGLHSDAAGKFQLMARYWPPYKLQLKLPDFGPASQIRVMVQQVKECHALDDIVNGHLTAAIGKCSSRWASLPGNTYGQRQVALNALEDIYERSGGQFA